MAKEEYGAWSSYVQRRREDVADDPKFTFPSKTKSLLSEQFDRLKKRESQRLPSLDVTKMHGEFSSRFKLKVPIHPRLSLIHI